MFEFLQVCPLLVTGKRELFDFDVLWQLAFVDLSIEFGGEFLHIYIESIPIIIEAVAQIVKSDYYMVLAHRRDSVEDCRILVRVQSDRRGGA